MGGEDAHVLLVSFPGQGHVNPLLRLAKRLAAKGLLVTFSSTSSIGRKISSSSSDFTPVGNGRPRFDFFDDGLDPQDPIHRDIDALMSHLEAAGPTAVAALIRRQSPPVTFVVNNPFLPWVLDVAADAGIPSAVLWIQSAAVFATYRHYHRYPGEFPTVENPDVHVSIPGLPVMAPGDLPTFLLPSDPFRSLRDVILQQFRNIGKASRVLVNSFEELERDAIAALSDISPVTPIGPLVEMEESSGIRGDLLLVDDYSEWLDAQAPLSVVYVSVGSVVELSREEMTAVANGLRACGRPYFWVVREGSRDSLPEGFVEEEGRRGKGVFSGWAPQERVLAHAAVGCFVSHCGWNSTLEALAAGVPVVAFPQWGDQMPDAKFLVDVWGVGVRFRGHMSSEEVAETVEEAMGEGEAAQGRRRRAAEWKEAAMRAMASGGLSDRNIQEFVDHIRKGL